LPWSLHLLPRLSFGRLMTSDELTRTLDAAGIHEGIVAEAEALLTRHMAPPRPAPCRLQGRPL
jgi:hypothetical protein